MVTESRATFFNGLGSGSAQAIPDKQFTATLSPIFMKEKTIWYYLKQYLNRLTKDACI